MTAWLDALASAQASGQDSVLVTVFRTRGSSPREVGASMLVTEREIADSIGGGQLEYQCTAVACRWFRDGDTARPWTRTFPLGVTGGQCCGGTVDVLFEPITADRGTWVSKLLEFRERQQPVVLATSVDPQGEVHRRIVVEAIDSALPLPLQQVASDLLEGRATGCRTRQEGQAGTAVMLERLNGYDLEIAVFGAGHVGTAMIHALHPLPVRLHWIDSRGGVFPQSLPANVRAHQHADPAQAVARLPADCYYLVMTHSHAQDFDICTAIMERGPFKYLGLIGSRTKRRRFERRWRQLGLDDGQFRAVTCPIGIAGIHGERPHEIAVATAAQVLCLHGQHAGDPAATSSGIQPRPRSPRPITELQD